MRIAFFSYEFPVETGGGGIGTYIDVISRGLDVLGHSVIIFAGTKKISSFWENERLIRIPCSGWQEFNTAVIQFFLPIHQNHPFDVAECTDYCACGLHIKKLFPNLPIVVRLHTPLYLVNKLAFQPLTFLKKMRFYAGSFRMLKFPKLPHSPIVDDYHEEFELINLAERASSPSLSILNEMIRLGFRLEEKTDVVPLPFEVTHELQTIISRRVIKINPQIVFIGRLEKRKGVFELARAIPLVLRKYPSAHFTFVGEASVSPENGIDMISFLKLKLGKYKNSVTFTDKQPHDRIYHYLSLGDIFVFPSHYESFGIACCEAMSAGKAVIVSNEGGMREIVEDGHSGISIVPHKYRLLAASINRLIKHESLRIELGKNARNRIATYLNYASTIKRQIDCYDKAIDIAKNAC